MPMNVPPPTDKQARLIWLALTWLAIAALTVMIAGLFWALGKIIQVLSPVIWPVAVACVLAFLLDPLVDMFQRKGLSRTRAILAVFALAILILAAGFGIFVPQLVGEGRQLIARVPDIVTKMEDRLDRLASNPPPLLQRFFRAHPAEKRPPAGSINAVPVIVPASTNAPGTNAPALFDGAIDDKALQSAKDWLARELPNRARELGGWIFGKIGTWFGILISLILVPVYAFYFLTEKSGLEKNWTDYLPVANSRFKEELVFVLRALKNYLIAFFRGQVLVALCEGVLYTIGFLLIDLPYGLLLGASAAVLTIIPFLGATILCVVAFIIAVVQCGDWLHPFLVLAVVVVIQTLEAFWISPRIMKGRVGLHPAIIIFAVMAGTTLLGGLLGGILAIPLAAMIKVMLSRYVWKRRVMDA